MRKFFALTLAAVIGGIAPVAGQAAIEPAASSAFTLQLAANEAAPPAKKAKAKKAAKKQTPPAAAPTAVPPPAGDFAETPTPTGDRVEDAKRAAESWKKRRESVLYGWE